MVHAVVLVLGDLGRSPRMQYHASSLSRLPAIDSVTQIGYIGERVMYPDNVLVSEKRFAPWDFNFIRKVALLHAGGAILDFS